MTDTYLPCTRILITTRSAEIEFFNTERDGSCENRIRRMFVCNAENPPLILIHVAYFVVCIFKAYSRLQSRNNIHIKGEIPNCSTLKSNRNVYFSLYSPSSSWFFGDASSCRIFKKPMEYTFRCWEHLRDDFFDSCSYWL